MSSAGSSRWSLTALPTPFSARSAPATFRRASTPCSMKATARSRLVALARRTREWSRRARGASGFMWIPSPKKPLPSQCGGFSLQIKKTNPADYVRNIHVIMPGFEETWQQDPFHPVFLGRWQGTACFRFKDWMHTDKSRASAWEDRPTLGHATFF